MWIDANDHLLRWLPLVAALGCAAGGCQHHRANQYSYAPPLAPPVYPQPRQGTGPVVFGPPGAALPASSLPAGSLPPGGAFPMAAPVSAPVLGGGSVVTQGMVVSAGDPCDPCGAGVVTAGPAFGDGGQAQPCP